MLFNPMVYQIGGGEELTAIEKKASGMTVRMPIPEGATKFFVFGLSGITGSVAKQICYSSYELISGNWRHNYSHYVGISFTQNNITIVNTYDGSASVDVTVTFIISS